MSVARDLLRISRPRFWLYLGGTYLVGFAFGADGAGDYLTLIFAVHLAYFMMPANLFLYGINDLFDEDTDQHNPKKGRQEHRLRRREKRIVGVTVAACAALGLLLAALQPLPEGSLLLVAFLALGAAYSAPPARLKARPLLDFPSNVLYATPGFLGFVHSSGHLPPPAALIGAAAWTGAMHLFSAVPDIEADRSAGIATTATLLGARGSLALCSVLWLVAAVGAVVLALGGDSALAMAVAAVALVYPGISAALVFAPDLTSRAYWHFPWLNGLVGFGLFLLAVLA